MAPKQITVITCDHRGCKARHYTFEETVRDARRSARGEGWTRQRRRGQLRDLCPEHSAK